MGGLSILWNPRPVFEAVRDDPRRRWLVPLLLVLVAGVAATTFHLTRTDLSADLLAQMSANLPEGQEDAADQLEGMVGAIAAFTMAAAYLGPIAWLLGLGFVAWLMSKVLGGVGTYGQGLAVAALSQMPQAYAALLGVPVAAMHATAPNLQELQTLLRVHPAAFTALEATSPGYALSAAFGLFSVWSLVLAIWGTATVFSVDLKKSALGWGLLKLATTGMAVAGAAAGAAAGGMG